MREIETEIRHFIMERFLVDEGAVKPNADLFADGILDSFAFIQLLSWFEQRWGVSFDLRELSISRFRTIEQCAQFLSTATEDRG